MSTDDAGPAPADAGRASSPAPTLARRKVVRMLRSPAEFTRCLGVPASYRSGAFALHLARVAADGGTAVWRLGLVIPKRYEKSAVARNTIKRRWRAAFRQGHERLSAEFGSADLVVRLQGPLVPRSAAAAVAAASKPAKRRARTQFDPHAMLASLGERLRRGVAPKAGRPARPAS